MPSQILLRVADVVKLLSISPSTLANQRSKKIGIPYHKIGRSVRYDLEEVESYLKSRKIETDDFAYLKITLE
jgi:predicted DNA-binding transcriptional regulator AlpA